MHIELLIDFLCGMLFNSMEKSNIWMVPLIYLTFFFQSMAKNGESVLQKWKFKWLSFRRKQKSGLPEICKIRLSLEIANKKLKAAWPHLQNYPLKPLITDMYA